MRQSHFAILAALLAAPAVAQQPNGVVPASVEPARGDVTINSVRLHYLEWGMPGKPVILLLTGTGGLGGVADQWQDFATRLAHDYHIYAPEMRGTAQSEWRGPYTWRQIIADIDEFVHHFHLAPVLLVGHSAGANWGVAYAALHPTTVTRFVAVDPGGNPWSSAAPPGLPTFKSREDVYTFAKERWGISPHLDSLLRYVIATGTRTLGDGTVAWTIDPAALSSWVPRGGDMLTLLAELRVPTLVVRGATSPWPRETALRWKDAIKNVEYVEVSSAGHVVPMANPAGFAEAVCPFLGVRRCPSRPANER